VAPALLELAKMRKTRILIGLFFFSVATVSLVASIAKVPNYSLFI